jgi:ribonuclease P protein component
MGARGELRPRLRQADFVQATSLGKRLVAQRFLLFVRDRGDGGPTRLGITVTRKVANAVGRNRIKRLVREWFRQRPYGLGPCDLVVVAKRGISTRLGLEEVRSDLDAALASQRR